MAMTDWVRGAVYCNCIPPHCIQEHISLCESFSDCATLITSLYYIRVCILYDIRYSFVYIRYNYVYILYSYVYIGYSYVFILYSYVYIDYS